MEISNIFFSLGVSPLPKNVERTRAPEAPLPIISLRACQVDYLALGAGGTGVGELEGQDPLQVRAKASHRICKTEGTQD